MQLERAVQNGPLQFHIQTFSHRAIFMKKNIIFHFNAFMQFVNYVKKYYQMFPFPFNFNRKPECKRECDINKSINSLLFACIKEGARRTCVLDSRYDILSESYCFFLMVRFAPQYRYAPLFPLWRSINSRNAFSMEKTNILAQLKSAGGEGGGVRRRSKHGEVGKTIAYKWSRDH